MNNPYPGLRPFKYEESYLFFGREGQSEDLLRRLEKSHFVAVVGTSGSGKSSLVRAGLLPLLSSGFMPNTRGGWRVAVFRPGEDPIRNLAGALAAPAFSPAEQTTDDLQAAITERILRRSAVGLLDCFHSEDFASDENLLVVVDQFEEIFRFKKESRRGKPDEEAADFVKLLLEATRGKTPGIYVIITMRSDFLGDCAEFRQLPEAINDGQYLIPRLTREQLRQVIESPAKVHGARTSPALVTHLLNDVGDDQDQLPILQHALMRTWEQCALEGNPDTEISFKHYQATGGMEEALSKHADEAFAELTDDQKTIAEKMFKAITEIDRENRETRRATSLEKISRIADALFDQVIPVIETFRRKGRTFLMPPVEVELQKDSLIDISHESLIRKWKRMDEWVDEEAESAQTYRRLAEDSFLHKAGKMGYWSEPGLSIALAWREQFKPNETWAGLYYKTWGRRGLSDYPETMGYLEDSRKYREALLIEEELKRNREVKRLRRFVTSLAVMSILILAFSGFAVYLYTEAKATATREELNRDALTYLEKGDLEQAEIKFKELIEKYESIAQKPNQPIGRWWAWHNLGIVYSIKKDFGNALNAFEKALMYLDIDEDGAENKSDIIRSRIATRLRLAQLYRDWARNTSDVETAQQRNTLAIKNYNLLLEMLKADSTNQKYLSFLADLYIDLAEAVSFQSNDDSTDPTSSIKFFDEAMQDLNEAMKIYRQNPQNYPRQVATLKKMAEYRIFESQLLSEVPGSEYAEKARTKAEEAIAFLKQAIDIQEDAEKLNLSPVSLEIARSYQDLTNSQRQLNIPGTDPFAYENLTKAIEELNFKATKTTFTIEDVERVVEAYLKINKKSRAEKVYLFAIEIGKQGDKQGEALRQSGTYLYVLKGLSLFYDKYCQSGQKMLDRPTCSLE